MNHGVAELNATSIGMAKVEYGFVIVISIQNVLRKLILCNATHITADYADYFVKAFCRPEDI